MVSSHHPSSRRDGSTGLTPAPRSVLERLKPQPKNTVISFPKCPPPGPFPRAGVENSSAGSSSQTPSPRFSASAYSIAWHHPDIHLCTFFMGRWGAGDVNPPLHSPAAGHGLGFPVIYRGSASHLGATGAQLWLSRNTRKKTAGLEEDLYKASFF